ncbi:hypothetical protein [Marinobacter alexandrii]|jgi:hypothetical protein|uniref:hypothetical protein n=1 Tax=Marinobacter alexandrii TaxID=2570351 RepID=UPI002ABDF766|nr:hypothetical protein [Marinobacter alexandrii]
MSELYAGIFGVLIGACFAALGFMYRRRLDNLSRLHEALFQLLDLYGAMRLMQPVSVEQNLEWYFEVAQEVFPEEPVVENKEELKKQLLPVIIEASKRVTEVSETDLASEYCSAISQVSPIAPVLAYRLSVNRLLKSAIAQVDQYNEHVRELLSEQLSEEGRAQLEFVITTMRKRISMDISKTLRKDITILSMRCDLISFFALVKSLYLTKGQTMEEIMKEEYRWILLEAKQNSAGEA